VGDTPERRRNINGQTYQMKLTLDEQRMLISDESIKKVFLQREDIVLLSPDEQECRWQEHLLAVNQLREWLSGLDSIVVTDGRILH
jgi:hypothetical protein